MKVPVKWLREYVDFPWSTDELADRMTMSGLKVEAVERPGAEWGDVIIAQIVELSPHPTSNKPLNVAAVDTGSGQVTVVTGAPNVFAGAKAPIVLVGGNIPHGPDGGPLRIEARPMAGIASNGMLASARELGLSDDHTGILILPEDAPVGAPLAEYYGDEVIDIETVSNRPDTLSMIGIAREIAVLAGTDLCVSDPPELPEGCVALDEESIAVEVLDTVLCPRYSALRVEGFRDAASPNWLAQRLEASGMRPINLLVDLSNYVMLEYGQPTHAFDASQLRGDRIVVRQAGGGETIRTLDGADRAIPPDSLVIADAERAVAVAGVMGGEDSEIRPDTKTLVLESANFNAPSVRRTAQALGLRTEASSRFEKGLPPETTVPAMRRFVQLLAEITGAELRIARVSDVFPEPPQPRTVSMPLRDLHRLLGIEVPEETAKTTLERLGFAVTLDRETLRATVPYWRRVDIERSADLVEEIGRIVGFDAIPSTLPRRTLQPPVPSPAWFWEGRARERLMAVGVNEAQTHTLTSPALMARLAGNGGEPLATWDSLVANPDAITAAGASLAPVSLMNPASADRQVTRLSLVPSLLDVAARNLKITDERVAFFEIARTYFPRGEEELPYERRTLAIALTGRRRPRSWQEPDPGPYSFYDLKGIVEALLEDMGIVRWRLEPSARPALHPGRSATLTAADRDAGYLGELHPDVAERFELGTWRTQIAEIDFGALVASASSDRGFRALPRYPAAYRDIAVVVDRGLPAERIVSIVRSAAGDILEFARIFDVYNGPNLPTGTLSIAVEMIFRSHERTLTQEEVDAAVSNIVSALSRDIGAVLRD